MPTFLTWWRGRRTPASARGADMRAVRKAVDEAQAAAEETQTSEALARSMQAPPPAAASGPSLHLAAPPAARSGAPPLPPSTTVAADDEEDFYSSPTPAAPPRAAAAPPKAAEAPPKTAEEAKGEAEEEAGEPAPGRMAGIGPDGVTWWTDAMADLAARTGRSISAADMLRMCRDLSFDAGFVAFAGRALGLPPAAAKEAVAEQAASEIGELEGIAREEAEAEAAGVAMRAQGIPV